ncbi:hypothetical protein ACRAWB_14570 [Leifsonia poae]|uniref:hypothetical protein n=1 Tax=Leifsonia poae TaxID=110933 RepID=UPI003D68E6D6
MSGRSGGVLVYVSAAVAARSADAGAIVAAVLAGTTVAGPAAGGLLAAALTVPHLIGPLAGRLLDGRSQPGPVLAAAFVWYAVFVAGAAMLLPVSVAGAAVALAAAGCAGPLVTGGLSSRLAGIVAGTRGHDRRDGTASADTSDARSRLERRGPDAVVATQERDRRDGPPPAAAGDNRGRTQRRDDTAPTDVSDARSRILRHGQDAEASPQEHDRRSGTAPSDAGDNRSATAPSETGDTPSATAPSDAGDTRSRTQRRGQALDALTYGVSATVGPAAVAVLAAALNPVGALGATAALLLVAAAIVLWLPANAQHGPAQPEGSVLRLLVTSAPLRRTTVATIGSATALAAAPLIATALAGQRGAPPATAAVLMSLYGAGGLLASLLLIARPLTGDPERLVRTGVVIAGVALLAPLLALPFPTAGGLIGGVAFTLIGAASSALFAATLAARTEYSPPGAAARVFATVAGIKVGGSALGVAAAGLVAPLGPAVLIGCSAAVCGLTLAVIAVDAAVASRRARPATASTPSTAVPDHRVVTSRRR